jgi:hypothetical protein
MVLIQKSKKEFHNMLIDALLLCLAFTSLFTSKAHAYLDPGTGSYFFQLAIAALLSSIVFFRSFGTRIKRWFKPPQPGEEKLEVEPEGKLEIEKETAENVPESNE